MGLVRAAEFILDAPEPLCGKGWCTMSFEIPEDLAALSLDELRDAIDAAVAEAASIDGEPDSLDDDAAQRLSALAEFVTSAREKVVEIETADAQRAEAVANARAALAAPEDTTDDGDESDAGDQESVAEEAAAQASDEADEEQPVGTKEPVAASSGGSGKRRSVVARAGRSAPPVEAPDAPVVSLVAAAEVPGYATGTTFEDMGAVAKALETKMQALPKHRIGGKEGTRIRHSVATIQRDSVRTDGLTQSAFGRDDMALLNAARKESRLPGGSLVAAGGWCAPSETIYDICTTATTDGLLDLPEMTIDRGGLRWTSGPDFSAIFDQIADQCMTEQDVIDGQLKDCITVDCPEFEEKRLDACWLCIRVGLLTQAGYPEYVQAYIDTAMIANAHKMSARNVAAILAGSKPVNAAGDFVTSIDSLAELELVAMYQRQRWALSDSQSLEVLLPSWYKAVVRADLARRNGVEAWNVTDAQIQSYFANRMLSVQWLKYLYPIQGDDTTDADGNVTATDICIPPTIDVPMYPAGTWLRGVKDVISLDAVYDSQSLSANEYTALFVEDGSFVIPMCDESVKVTITTCGSGNVAVPSLTDCVLGQCAS